MPKMYQNTVQKYKFISVYLLSMQNVNIIEGMKI